MRPVLWLTMLTVVLGLPTTPAQEEKVRRTAADTSKAASELVTGFFKHWKEGQASRYESHLLYPDATIVGVTHIRPVKPWKKGLREWLVDLDKDPPRHLELDHHQTDVSQGSIAVVTAKYTGAGIFGRMVFTLVWHDERWKIAGIVTTTHHHW